MLTYPSTDKNGQPCERFIIGCAVVACEGVATKGGIFRHDRRPDPAHPTYYACADHENTLDDALRTWPTNQRYWRERGQD